MTKKTKHSKSKGAPGKQNPHAIFPKPLPAVLHGLHLDLLGVDGRTRPAKAVKALSNALLERFPSPAPAAAQLLAQRCAFKLIRAGLFEAFVLKGGKPVVRAEEDYIRLTESIRKDIQALWVMAQNGGSKDSAPSLAEYLEAITTGKLVPVEAQTAAPPTAKEEF